MWIYDLLLALFPPNPGTPLIKVSLSGIWLLVVDSGGFHPGRNFVGDDDDGTMWVTTARLRRYICYMLACEPTVRDPLVTQDLRAGKDNISDARRAIC